MITTMSLVTIYHRTSYYNIIGYVPYAVQNIPMTYFVTVSLYLLILFTYFAHPPTPLSSGNH